MVSRLVGCPASQPATACHATACAAAKFGHRPCRPLCKLSRERHLKLPKLALFSQSYAQCWMQCSARASACATAVEGAGAHGGGLAKAPAACRTLQRSTEEHAGGRHRQTRQWSRALLPNSSTGCSREESEGSLLSFASAGTPGSGHVLQVQQ